MSGTAQYSDTNFESPLLRHRSGWFNPTNFAIEKVLLLLFSIVLLTLLAACGREDSTATEDGQTSTFQLIVISDPHIRLPGLPDDETYNNQGNLDNFQAAIERINAEYWNADFVAVTGDLVGNLYSDDPEDYLIGTENPAETFKVMIETLIPPVYVTLGNHDYQTDFDPDLREGISTTDIETIEAVWKKVLGIDPYYAVTHKGVKMIFLNSNRGPRCEDLCEGSQIEAFCTGSFDEKQLLWLENQLEEEMPAILFLHHPPHTDNPNTGWTFYHSYRIDPEDPFYDLTETYRHTILAIFVGHGHRWKQDTLHDSIPVFETGAIGDQYGRPDHIHVVDVDPYAREVTVMRLDQ